MEKVASGIKNNKMKLKTLLNVVRRPSHYSWYFLGKMMINYQNPKYRHGLYEFCRRYVNFYRNDENGDRETNGMWRWLEKFMLTKPKTIFDIGGFNGEYSLKIINLDPSVELHVFEANKDTFRGILIPALKGFKKVHLVCKGVSDKEGTATLFTSKKSGATDSLHYRGNMLYEQDGSMDVEITTIDAYSQENGIEYIDLLKIDTEGNDLSVLRGAEKMLRGGRIGTIVFEFSILYTYSHVYFPDFTDYLSQFGYSVSKIMPNGLKKIQSPEQERSQHAYFVATK